MGYLSNIYETELYGNKGPMETESPQQAGSEGMTRVGA
jgi:hypothetical protein